ncbi:Crocetin glucosyltransferase, chloroplastic [Hordeum vulgare]|nr:Crocetin glucosyltransferase, chloroplastic [Hordeum vulgare]
MDEEAMGRRLPGAPRRPLPRKSRPKVPVASWRSQARPAPAGEAWGLLAGDGRKAAGARSVGELVDALAARGRPVTRVVYTMLLPWAADVAREKGLPSMLYWIQPAAVLAVYYHYFHGYAAVVADHRHDPSFIVRFPGLPPQEKMATEVYALIKNHFI